MPKTWVGISKEIEGEVLPFTPVNEDYIATLKIQQLLNRGFKPREIALIWNGTLGGSERPVEKKNTNKLGVAYDTVAYSLKVMTAYAQE